MATGCDEGAIGGTKKATETNDEKIITRTVHNMEVMSSKNGGKDRLMRAPIMEEHAFATNPFEEFVRGMEVIGFDSIGNPSSKVVADYALHWIDLDLWELNGNVLVEGEQGQKLYTQQLRWDRKIGKIYSNVDSKFEESGDVLYGVSFQADDDFKHWIVYGTTGTVSVNMEPTADSTAVAPVPTPGVEGVEGTASTPATSPASEPPSAYSTPPASSPRIVDTPRRPLTPKSLEERPARQFTPRELPQDIKFEEFESVEELEFAPAPPAPPAS
jgi:hypothetical protein